MKRITITLVTFVLIAVTGLGWALDTLFAQINSPAKQDDLFQIRQLGASLAATLNAQPSSAMTNWRKTDKAAFNFSVESIKDLGLPQELDRQLISGQALQLATDNNLSVHFYLPAHQKVLTLTLPKQADEQNSQPLKAIFTGAFYLGIIIITILWLKPLLTQLEKLKAAAIMFGQGKLNVRVNTSKASLISDIETAFNHMAARIETLIGDNKLLTNAVSHDLRTPLARLRFGIEALQETKSEAQRLKYQQHLSHDIDEMEQLVSVLLDYARLDHPDVAKHCNRVNLSALTLTIAANYRATEKVINVDVQPDLHLSGDANHLSMLLNNLISNACQYGHTEINISLTKQDSKLMLTIEDDGPGIVPEQFGMLLKPFMRGEQSRTTKGFGMGLAIVNRIAQWHQATLTLCTDQKLGGACFRLTFNAS